MYCRYCGKTIADDSVFCKFCGRRVEDFSLEESSRVGDKNTEKLDNLEANTSERRKKIGNELVGNLKMVGLAVLLSAIYMIGFIFYHQKDIKEYNRENQQSYFGESCYDPVTLTGNWEFNWEAHYYNLLYFRLYMKTPFNLTAKTPEQYLKLAQELEEKIEKEKAIYAKRRKKENRPPTDLYSLIEVTDLDEIKQDAKDLAARDIASWDNRINDYRRSGYIRDMKTHALYSFLICLALTVIGRYLIKLAKRSVAYV